MLTEARVSALEKKQDGLSFESRQTAIAATISRPRFQCCAHLAVLHGARKLAEYDSTGQLLIPEIKTVA